ncbi:MAG: hypothetical protein U0521_28640 [Anaerolineae bacterium]
MCYGDALLIPVERRAQRSELRLEYLQPAVDPVTLLGGFDYYKLITPARRYVVHIRSSRLLPERQRQIAERLLEMGARPEALRLIEFGATTPPDARRWRLPHLLKPQTLLTSS